MYRLTVMSAVPNLEEEGGVDEVVAIMSETRHRSWAAAILRARKAIKGEIIELGETGWVPIGAMDYAEANPGRPILLAIIEYACAS